MMYVYFKACFTLYLLGILWISPNLLWAQNYPGVRSADDLGRIFIKSLQSQNPHLLSYLLPSSKVYQAIAPQETLGQSPQAMDKLKAIVKQRLLCNLDTIIRFFQTQSLDLGKLTYRKTQVQNLPPLNDPAFLHGLEVEITYQEELYLIRLLSVNFKNKWYLIEIILTEPFNSPNE